MNSVIVLDLDHTLIHSTQKGEITNNSVASFTIPDHVTVHIRPFVKQFLAYLLHEDSPYKVVIWTAGQEQYAFDIIVGLFHALGITHLQTRLAHVLTRNDTFVAPDGHLFKDLSVVEKLTGSSEILLLDDQIVHARHNPPDRVGIVPRFDVHDEEAEHDSFFRTLLLLTRKSDRTHGFKKAAYAAPKSRPIGKPLPQPRLQPSSSFSQSMMARPESMVRPQPMALPHPMARPQPTARPSTATFRSAQLPHLPGRAHRYAARPFPLTSSVIM